MENVNCNNKTIQTKQPSTGKKIGATLAGLAITGTAKQGVSLVSSKVLLPNMQKVGKSLSDAEYAQIKDAIKNLTTKANLAQKGVDIITVNSENAKQIEEMLKETLSKKIKFIPKDAFSLSANILTGMVKNGENAFFANSANKIFIGDSKELAASVFHEAGHAMNYNLNKFTKVLQKCQPLRMLAVPIALISLIHTDKTNKNGEQSKLNKAGGFVKKHAAGLTLLSFIPTVAEEGLASLRGAKLAKQMLDPNLVKKINKTNLLGFASYVLMAVAASVGIHLAVKAADKIRAPKENNKTQA